jgi:tRNA uridine 5-carboxymethylaminomethyl modification enzyme
MGRKSNLLYLQGCSISFPIKIQEKILKTIPALKNVKIEIPGYAIVYDYVKPYELKSNLETKKVKNLFLAGQINGTSGYEEAAAQGLMAGINAVLKIRNQKQFILKRNEAYIGVLIDDLITKIHKEPYRIYTGSAEYRLLLRQSNADIRLAKHAFNLGLIKEKDYQKTKEKKNKIENIIEEMKETKENGKSLWKLLKQPEIKIEDYVKNYSFLKKNTQEIIDEVETEIKYEDYIKRQEESVKKDKSMEDKSLDGINYDEVTTIRNLAKERLKEVKPASIGQASRIAGVTSADITALLIYLKKISKS